MVVQCARRLSTSNPKKKTSSARSSPPGKSFYKPAFIQMPEVMTMKASVLCDVQRLEVRDIPRPVISPYEVLIRVTAVGLCGTDVHIFAGHANYNTNQYGQQIPLALQPQILGHEIAGVVEQVGGAVRDLRESDRVVIDQGLNCVSRRREVLCRYCRTESSHQCEFY